MGHLRSFDVSELKSDKSNQLSIQKKPTVRHIYQMPCPKVRFREKLTISGLTGHLRSFGGHLEVIWWSFGVSKFISSERI